MIKLNGIHHIAIICSNYERSKHFYINILGLKLIREIYREQRLSYKADLALNDKYVIELFSFPAPPPRLSRPEGTGLRHLAFEVENIDATVRLLQQKNIIAESIRIDETTGKRFTFIADPDDLPIEFYEV
jgi:glyoxylase I family protein